MAAPVVRVCRLLFRHTVFFSKKYIRRRTAMSEKTSSMAGSNHYCSSAVTTFPHEFIHLAEHSPCFLVSGSQVHVLHEPSDFYELLKNSAGSAQRRIVLASLYLNTGTHEQDLIDAVYANCEAARRENRHLEVIFLFDYFRGSRGDVNTRTICRKLLADFPDCVRVYLYHTPDLRGLLKAVTPERFNETVGVTHLKVYLFDDSVIMSGANLDDKYFTQRQDRYILVTDTALADFFSMFIKTVASFCLQLHSDNSLTGDSQFAIDPCTGDPCSFKQKAKHAVESLLQSYKLKYDLQEMSTIHRSKDNTTDLSTDITNTHHILDNTFVDDEAEYNCDTELGTLSVNPDIHQSCLNKKRIKTQCSNREMAILTGQNLSGGPMSFNSVNHDHSLDKTTNITEVLLQSNDISSQVVQLDNSVFNENTHDNIRLGINDNTTNDTLTPEKSKARRSSMPVKDTWIFPLVQMGPLGIGQDEDATLQLLRNSLATDTIRLASGYFNLTDSYRHVILQESCAKYMLLLGSPQVNGFYKASGLAWYIPAAYAHIARTFYTNIRRSLATHRVVMHEYTREAWSYHVKGLWYYRGEDTTPLLTLVGSPNFGYRSVQRDLEAQVAIVTTNQHLRDSLHQENVRLFERSSVVSDETFSREEYHVPGWVKWVTAFIKDYL